MPSHRRGSVIEPTEKLSEFLGRTFSPAPPSVYEAVTSSLALALFSHYTDNPISVFPLALALSTIINNKRTEQA